MFSLPSKVEESGSLELDRLTVRSGDILEFEDGHIVLTEVSGGPSPGAFVYDSTEDDTYFVSKNELNVFTNGTTPQDEYDIESYGADNVYYCLEWRIIPVEDGSQRRVIIALYYDTLNDMFELRYGLESSVQEPIWADRERINVIESQQFEPLVQIVMHGQDKGLAELLNAYKIGEVVEQVLLFSDVMARERVSRKEAFTLQESNQLYEDVLREELHP